MDNTLKNQLAALWQQIENDSQQQQTESCRLKAVELAKLLLDWEAHQPAPLSKRSQNLQRIAYWKNIAQTTTTQLDTILPTLESTKTELIAGIEQVQQQIESQNQQLTPLIAEIEQQIAGLGLADAELATLQQRQQQIDQQRQALIELQSSLDQMETLRQRLAAVNQQLAAGELPQEYQQVLELSLASVESLKAYYQSHIDHARQNTTAMMSLSGSERLQSLPDQLQQIESQLRQVDQTLKEQILAQQQQDRTVAIRL